MAKLSPVSNDIIDTALFVVWMKKSFRLVCLSACRKSRRSITVLVNVKNGDGQLNERRLALRFASVLMVNEHEVRSE